MIKIIGVTNQKGGVGKTTTAVNLAACLSAARYETLLVDMDPQGNATSGTGVDRFEITHTIYSALVHQIPLDDILIKTPFQRLSLLPANVELVGAEVELSSALSREYRLKHLLEQLSDRFQFIIIDAPPSLGILTANVLSAAHSVIIPVQCEYYALEGLSSLIETIEYIKDGFNPQLDIEGILITMYDSRTNLSKQVVDEIKNHFSEKVYETIIPRSIRLSEAPSFGKPIIYYEFNSTGSQTYIHFTREFVERLHKKIQDNSIHEDTTTEHTEDTPEDNHSLGISGTPEEEMEGNPH